jgi:hypothetical protein
MIPEHVLHSAQTLHLSCVKISTISNKLNQASTWASSPRSTIGCVQNDFWAYSMFSTNPAPILNRHQHISKWTKTRFHMTHVTLELHRVRPKWFLRLWYVWHKPCTYLTLRLALSSNRLNRASTWPRRLGVPSGASKTISEPMVRSEQTVHLSCIKISTITNELDQASTWASSPRSIIKCIQNDFWAFGTFGAYQAPILCQDYHYIK